MSEGEPTRDDEIPLSREPTSDEPGLPGPTDHSLDAKRDYLSEADSVARGAWIRAFHPGLLEMLIRADQILTWDYLRNAMMELAAEKGEDPPNLPEEMPNPPEDQVVAAWFFQLWGRNDGEMRRRWVPFRDQFLSARPADVRRHRGAVELRRRGRGWRLGAAGSGPALRLGTVGMGAAAGRAAGPAVQPAAPGRQR